MERVKEGFCEECCAKKCSVVSFEHVSGTDEDGEDERCTVWICATCLKKALRLFESSHGQEKP